MTAPVLIQVLGGFRLTVGGRVVSSLPRKAQALLAYLAVQDGRPVTRESVSDLLWTDRGAEQARHSLRQTLLVLRREMPDVIGGDARTLSFRPDLVGTDIGPFLRLARSRERADLAEAGELFRGELLADFPAVARDFDDWLEGARTEQRELAIDLYRRLSDACFSDGASDASIVAAEHMVAFDPTREDSHRLLIARYLAAGRRGDAVRQYESLVEILRREFGVAPSPESISLGKSLRDERGPPSIGSLPSVTPVLAGSRGPSRIAVLPLEQIGSSTVADHIRDGLVEDIVQQLAGLRSLSVISHGTTRQFRGQNLSLQDIGRQVDARYIVRGSLRRSGNDVRLVAELSDVASGQVLWARTHDTTASLSFDDQDRIVSHIVHSLTSKVTEAEIVRIRGKRVDDMSIYEKVLLARDLIARLGKENFLAAQSLMNQVMAEAPDWGEAYSLAADCHGMLLGEAWSQSRDHHLAEIEKLTNRALILDADNVRALTFYGHRKTIFYRDHDSAVDLFRKALEVAPHSAQAWLWSSYTYTYIGDAEQAISRGEKALSLSPADREAYWFYLGLCMAYYTRGDFDVACDWGRRALAEPIVGHTGPRRVVAALAAAGRMTEARDLAKWVMDQGPETHVTKIISTSPYREAERREMYGRHLALAGFPE